MEGLALGMGQGETPAFLHEPRGLTQRLGSYWAGVRAFAGGCLLCPHLSSRAGELCSTSSMLGSPQLLLPPGHAPLGAGLGLCGTLHRWWTVIWENGSYMSAPVREGRWQHALWKRIC